MTIPTECINSYRITQTTDSEKNVFSISKLMSNNKWICTKNIYSGMGQYVLKNGELITKHVVKLEDFRTLDSHPTLFDTAEQAYDILQKLINGELKG